MCPPRCNWNIVESGVKHYQSNQIFVLPEDTWTFILKCIVFSVRNYRIECMCICYCTIYKVSFWATNDSLTPPLIAQESERSCIVFYSQLYMNGIEQQAMPIQDLWKIKIKYHTVGTFPNSNWTIVKTLKLIPLTHTYMSAYWFSGD